MKWNIFFERVLRFYKPKKKQKLIDLFIKL